MVIEKILKVNSADPKVEELRKKLAALQQTPATPPTQSSPQAQMTPVAPSPSQIAPAQQPARLTQEQEIARLQQLSADEQKNLLQRQNPELRLKEERTLHLVTNQIKELINLNNEANKRIRELEGKHTQLEKSLEIAKDKEEEMLQKMNSIDSRLEKFMGLYELITNQYNPFADHGSMRGIPQVPSSRPTPQATIAQAPPSTPSQPRATGQAQVIKVEDNLTNKSATVDIADHDAQEATDRFKRVEQMLADLKKQEEARNEPQPTPTVAAPVNTELHSLLFGFEQRLRQHVDQTIQSRLHQGLTSLEANLQAELRDALRRELEALQQDDAQVQQSVSELQELLHASEGANREQIETEVTRLTQELEALREDVRAIAPNLYFQLADGTVLKNLGDFKRALHSMSPETYARHVQGNRNDFADWIQHALGRPRMAAAVRGATSWPELEAAMQLKD